MPAQSKRRAQGGGRVSNSEPRQQVFRDFGGCNFQLSPRDFTLGKNEYQEQSDLQMNYVVVQNNVKIADNRTLESRNNLIKLFNAPNGINFTDAAILISNELFVGMSDGSVRYGNLSNTTTTLSNTVNLINNTSIQNHNWNSFAYVDDKLVGTTSEDQLWTGLLSEHELENARQVSKPSAFTINNLTARGNLEISTSLNDSHPYRISLAYAYINKYGPTQCSNQFTIYANYPVDEWHSGRYLEMHGTAPVGYNIEAVEIYYTVGNAATLQFAGRTDMLSGDGGEWSFKWFGYLDTTSMWPMANLIAPTENLTSGVKASYVTCIDSRLYFWGSRNNPQRLWIGGNPGNLFSVSPGTGGGFVDVEPGTGQEIRFVDKYKTQSGNSIVTMLCDSKNSSKEQRYNLVENSITISNEQSMKSWQAEQVAGAVGCKSHTGAVVCEDGLYSVSRYGLALTTMTMEYNSQIRANYVSDPIKPAFTNKLGNALKNSILLECDGVIYMAFGSGDAALDNLIFCYDINLRSWWTITLDLNSTIRGLIHIDAESFREGIGIITDTAIYLLPLTDDDSPNTAATFNTTIQTGELSITQPQQNWFYLSQLEFRFDYFIGNLTVELTGIDQFGRKVKTKKTFSHSETAYNFAEYMRVDLRLQSYQIRITGQARFRMTHFIAKVYTMSAKQGLVWGFDDSQSYRSDGDIHPTFKDYNDIKRAIIP